MPHKKIEGTKIHLADSGTGPAVLLLHAFPLSGGMWKKQIAALRASYRVIAPDLPGFGGSPPPTSPASIAGFAALGLGLLDALGVEKAAVVGLSMGGYVALELQAAASERVSALVLCDTKAHADTEDGKRAREATAHAVEEEGSTQPLIERLLPNLLSPAASPELRREVERLIADTSVEGAAAAQRAMAKRRDFTPELGKIGCPTLVLVGGNDTLSTSAELKGIAQAIPNARFQTIPGAGHLSNIEKPEAFNAALRSFLDDVLG
ncbi:MAG: alpha/beta fold hydrolase [Myxococcales bacterium]|jgi:3-oxoadipate enol-lactonase